MKNSQEQSNENKTNNSIDNAFINILPDEIFLYIFSFLNRKELSILSQVSKRLSKLSNDKQLLKKIKICIPADSKNICTFNTNVIVVYNEHNLYMWDFETISPVATLKNAESSLFISAVSPDNKYLVIISEVNSKYFSMTIWNLNSKKREKRIKLANSSGEQLIHIKSLKFLNDEKLCVVCAGTYSTAIPFAISSSLLQIYAIDGSLNMERSFPAEFEFTNISKNNQWIVCQDSDSIYIYSNVNFPSEESLILHSTKDEICRKLQSGRVIDNVHISNSGKTLIFIEDYIFYSGMMSLTVYDIEQKQIIKKITPQKNWHDISSLDISSNGKYVITAMKYINIYDINKEKDQECIHTFKFEEKPRSVFFTKDYKGMVVFFKKETQFIDFHSLGIKEDFVDEEIQTLTSQLSK